MTNLIKEAAKYNYYTLDTVPQQYQTNLNGKLINDYFIRDIEAAKNTLLLFDKLRLTNTFDVGIFIECKQDNYNGITNYYVESHLNIFLMQKDSNVICKLHYRKNQYFLHPLYNSYAANYHKLSLCIRQELSRNPSPNYIGVFTIKKLNDWFAYCANYIISVNNAFDSANNVIGESKDFVKNYVEQIKPYIIKSYIYEYDIFVRTSLFEVQFKINKETGFLTKKVEFLGSENDVLKIINNQSK